MKDDFFIVDCHNQAIPNEAIAGSKGTAIDLTDLNSARVAPLRHSLDIESKLRVMDEAGIDMAVIHMASLNFLGLDFCRVMNDGNARLAREYPGRFIPCAHIPLDGGGNEESITELERAISELGLKGVALESSTEKVTLSSPELAPLYEKILCLDIPVLVHPNNLKIVAMPDKEIQNLGGRQIAIEIENTTACAAVMFGVLSKFPSMKFLMPHHGGAFPLWKGRIMSDYLPEGYEVPDNLKNLPRTPRIRRELGLEEDFNETFDKIYFDTSGFQGWMPITEATLSVVKADRLCFGTDYGFEMLEAQDIIGFIEDIKKLNISEPAKRNILGENIRDLFKLDHDKPH